MVVLHYSCDGIPIEPTNNRPAAVLFSHYTLNFRGISIWTKMQEARDEVFCHLVSRRAVARAALHLGIEAMSKEALDVLGDIVLEYLQRIGRQLSILVESSGRSSAHVNILDAIHAIELCTSPAVQQLHMTSGAADGGPEALTNGVASATTATMPSDLNRPSQHEGWKGLAAFLFGPEWHVSDTAALPDASARASVQRARQGSIGGKIGPSASSLNEGSDIGLEGKAKKKAAGWVAPYPEEIPNFPTASDSVANPHTLTSAETLDTLHTIVIKEETQNSVDEAVEKATNQLDSLPESVFTSGWGSLASTQKAAVSKDGDVIMEEATTKRKRGESDIAQEPATKRVKLDGAEKKDVPSAAKPEELSNEGSVFPRFYPPLPGLNQTRRAFLDKDNDNDIPTTETKTPISEKASTKTQVKSADVRSALVQLGKHHLWGSEWDRHKALPKVEPGTNESTEVVSPIAPLDRASGSRVSRILEGSMDM